MTRSPQATKLPTSLADLDGMDVRDIEPRTVLWALAEISWEDPGGALHCARATLEDTSRSGACLRVRHPFAVGSRVTIKWSREQFCAVARNCRSDGRDYLIGVLRELGRVGNKSAPKQVPSVVGAPPRPARTGAPIASQQPVKASRSTVVERPKNVLSRPAAPLLSQPSQWLSQGSAPPRERKVMQPKGFLSKLWRSEPEGDETSAEVASTEAPVNKTNPSVAVSPSAPHRDLLSYEDIYHAAGIMTPRSGYSIHKVVDMLNSERLRELSKDAKRASVLMALDAAGTSADDLLHDAVRRQEALNSYDAGQRKQLEEFEAQKARENAQIEAEMERIKAHYAERIQRNNEQVGKEKETLHNWQAAMQYESQRIAEVIELCGKQPAATPGPVPAAAAASPASSTAEKAARAHGST